jgi:pyridoxine 5-phosphate synthase
VRRLSDNGIRVSLFIDPEPRQVDGALRVSAPVVELHTGQYCEAWLADDRAAAEDELLRLERAAELAGQAGLEVHAGHGLDFETAAHLAALPQIRELNIGHVIIGEAVFVGLPAAIARMLSSIAKGVAARDQPTQQQQQQ